MYQTKQFPPTLARAHNENDDLASYRLSPVGDKMATTNTKASVSLGGRHRTFSPYS